MDALIKEFCLEAQRNLMFPFQNMLLSNEQGQYGRLKEKVIRVMVREKFIERFDISRLGVTWANIKQQFELHEHEMEKLYNNLRGALNSLLKKELKSKQEKFNLEEHTKEQNQIVAKYVVDYIKHVRNLGNVA